MLNILFIGDINGRIGRLAAKKLVPKLRKRHAADLVIANAENAAHGSGITDKTIEELLEAKVDLFTMGDHSFDRHKNLDVYKKFPVIRPANYSPALKEGEGFKITAAGGHNTAVINLIGRVFMKNDHECPFHKLDEILDKISLLKENISAIIIDVHGECTSEKAALYHYANGRVSAVLGTHTHVMTRDEAVSAKGTAFITDIGMVGAADECIGVGKEGIIKTYRTQIRYPHVIPEKGKALFNAVLLKVNPRTRKAQSIKPIIEHVNIK